MRRQIRSDFLDQTVNINLRRNRSNLLLVFKRTYKFCSPPRLTDFDFSSRPPVGIFCNRISPTFARTRPAVLKVCFRAPRCLSRGFASNVTLFYSCMISNKSNTWTHFYFVISWNIYCLKRDRCRRTLRAAAFTGSAADSPIAGFLRHFQRWMPETDRYPFRRCI